MIESILALVSNWIIIAIQSTGYFGVFLLMVVQNANIPIPSEIILPFSGFLVSIGTFKLWAIIFWSTFGSLVGSLISYFLAGWMIKNRDRYKIIKILISDVFLYKSEKWFKKYGAISVGFSRVLPIVRTFISLPAGLGKMSLIKFSIYTTIGSFVWSTILVYFGWIFGENWGFISQYTKLLDYFVVISIIIIGSIWVYLHLFQNKHKKTNSPL